MLVVTGTRVTKNRSFDFNASNPIASGGLKVNAYEGRKTSMEQRPTLRSLYRTTIDRYVQRLGKCCQWYRGKKRSDNTDYV